MTILDGVAVDARSAARALRAQRGLVAVAVLILAIGLGATSALSRMTRGILLDPLPGVDPTGLLALGRNTLSHPDYIDLRSAAKEVAEVAAYVNLRMGMVGKEGERLVRGALVSDNYFQTLGVQPIQGRAFQPDDAALPVAVISDSLWRSHFGADPTAIGTSIRLGEETFTVIGVAPAGFAGVDLEYPTVVWAPLAEQPKVQPAQARFDLLNRRQTRWLGGVARLARGVTSQRAQEFVDTWTNRIQEAFPKGRRNWSIRLVPLAEAAISPGPRVAVVDLLRLVGLATGLMLLITCANLSILFLVGLVSRGGELGIRLAHGASHARLARQLLFETMAIATAGTALGLFLGGWLSRLGQHLILPPQISLQDLPLDGWTFSVTLAAAFLSSLAAIAVPLGRIRRLALSEVFRHSSLGLPVPRTDSAVTSRRAVLALPVAGQMALSLPLLYGVMVAAGSFVAQTRIDPGFRTDEVVLASLDAGVTRMDAVQSLAFYQRLKEGLELVPEVEVAALGVLAPIGDNRLLWEVAPPTGKDPTPVAGNVVSPGYFESLGIALLGGRDFDFELDGAGREPAVVINASLAQTLWPGQDPVGRTLELAGFDGPAPHRVIGLVADSRQGALQAPPEPFLYRPLSQEFHPNVTLHLRAAMPVAAVRDLVRESIGRLDTRVPLDEVRTLESDVDAALARPRSLALGMGLLGGAGALLAAIGLYGILSFSTRRRARDIAIRMSLGAGPRRIHLEILRRGLALALAGMVPGVALALALGRFLADRLYGLSAVDPLSLAGAALALAAVALLATELPARKAAAVDPAEVLRQP